MTKQELDAIAPPKPPCFDTPYLWVQYLLGAIDDHRGRAGGPLVFKEGEPVAFNFNFRFCDDCAPAHEAAMCAKGRCKPWHLKNLAKERQASDQSSAQAR